MKFAPVAVRPGTLAVGTREWTLKVPDVLAGDLLAAGPTADLPSGVTIAYARAPSADTVELALAAGIAVTIAAPIGFVLGALRG